MLKKLFVPLCLLSFFAVMVACQKDGGHSPYINNMTFDEKSEAEVAYKHTSVECEDKSQCPAYIGSIVLADESENQGYFYGSTTNYDIGFCSTQLIANNKVLTNRHCVPPSIAYEGADCSSKVMVKFPETNFHGAQDVRCNKVLSLSGRYPDEQISHPDWAILELESSVDRPFPEKDVSGLEHDTAFNIYPTYYTTSSIFLNSRNYNIGKGVIKKVDCVSSMNHAMVIGYFHSSSDLFSGTCNHEVIGGNSGSGIYKENGQLAGVISFAQKDKLKLLTFVNSSRFVKNHWTGGTNLSCVDEFNSNRSVFCDFKQRDMFSSILVHLVTLVVKSVESSEELIKQVDNKVSEQNFVKWSTPNQQSFLDMYGRESFESELADVPTEIKDLFLKYARHSDEEILKQRLPLFPDCVFPREANDIEFILEIPILTSDRSKFAINDVGRLTIPGEFNRLIYDFEYDLEEGKYIGRMQRMDEPLLSRYTKVRDEKFSSIDQCLALGVRDTTSNSECFGAKRAQSAYDLFLQRNLEQIMRIQNEEALGTFPRMENISLPVCEN